MLSNVLEVGIGLALVFLLFSLVVSGMHEGIARLFSWRSKALWAAIRQLVDSDDGTGGAKLRSRVVNVAPTDVDPRPTVAEAKAARTSPPDPSDPKLTVALYAHPLIGGMDKLHTTSRSKIQRLPSDQFAAALIDVLVPDGDGTTSVDRVAERVRGFPDSSPLKRPMLFFVSEAGQSLEGLRTKVEGWYDGQMERLQRRFRRRAKWWMLGLGVIVAVSCNVDALDAGQRLYKEDALRAAVVAQADAITTGCKDLKGEPLTACIKERSQDADDAVSLPVGRVDSTGDWKLPWRPGARNIFLSLFGWSLTAFALMQGGPFWFDLLGRGVALRRGRAGAAHANP